MNNISIIGVGKLGLCFGLTLERAGYNVVGCDISQEYIDSLTNRTFISDETNVNQMLNDSEYFIFTTDLKQCVNHSDIIFVTVATPSLSNGRYNHKAIDRVVDNIIQLGYRNKYIIIICTTMPGYCDTLQTKLNEYGCIVSYNPEFIAQGTILKNQARPDMVLIGEGSREAGDILRRIHKRHTKNEPKIFIMSRLEAEICKIGLNCFLTTKIAFSNMIGDIAEFSNCNPDIILEAIGSDSRIGNKYLEYGFGFGGPCFPRDNKALAIYANDVGIDAKISKASDESNKEHLNYGLQIFMKNNPKNKPVIFDFITYKKESTIIEESQQLAFAKLLVDNGYTVYINERQSVINQLDENFKNRITFI